jgi:hypothetical protein
MTNQYYRLAIVAGAAVVAFIPLAVRKRRQGKSRMNDEPQYREVFIDFLPNQPQTDQGRENFRVILRQGLEGRLEDSVARMWVLPQLAVKPEGEYLALLLESRELYVDGRFYSCVAMCGIVGERLVKDVLRGSVLIQKDGAATAPSEKAFDQFQRVEVYGIVSFLKEAGILSDDAARAARDLGTLRNAYSHARGKDAQADALKAIQLLHALVEGTVSIFKDFEIQDGAFVSKGAAAVEAPPGEA